MTARLQQIKCSKTTIFIHTWFDGTRPRSKNRAKTIRFSSSLWMQVVNFWSLNVHTYLPSQCENLTRFPIKSGVKFIPPKDHFFPAGTKHRSAPIFTLTDNLWLSDGAVWLLLEGSRRTWRGARQTLAETETPLRELEHFQQ